MTGRRQHRLTRPSELSHPQHAIFLDTETTTITPEEIEHRPALVLGIAQYITISRDGQLLSCDELVFRTVDELWVWMIAKSTPRQILYVYAHNWGFDWPCIDGFDKMDLLGWEMLKLVDSSPPVIIKYRKAKSKITIIDTLNYFRTSVKKLGVTLDLPKLRMPNKANDSKEMEIYCRRDVVIIRDIMLQLMQFLYTNNINRLDMTTASIALGSYVRNHMATGIMIDGDLDRVLFTRESYFGARTECFKIGRVEGPIYALDVNSQYPYYMKNERFPYNTIGMYKNTKLASLRQLCTDYCVTARVELTTSSPAYPVKLRNRTCFPVGKFVTVLSTPELLYALDNHHITKLYTTVIHDSCIMFKSYVNYFYNLRMKYKNEGNEIWSQLCKILLNSLYGKFGQSFSDWADSELEPKYKTGTWSEIDHGLSKRVFFRSINNKVQYAVGKTEAKDSFPAIAAHVTAYARIGVFNAIQKAGHENCYYSDTDSLYLNQTGYDSMKSEIDDNELGKWKLEGVHDWMEIRGAKDYTTPKETRTKGVRPDAEEIAPNTYRQIQFGGLRGVIQSRDTSAPIIRYIVKHLRREYQKGRVAEDGSISPWVLPGDAD